MLSSTDSTDLEFYLTLIEGHSGTDGINGRYYNASRIDSVGGGGGFSLIFKVDDRVSGDKVVLKFFNPLVGSDDYRKFCFNRESKILQSLNGQSNIIRLIEPKNLCRIPIAHPSIGLVGTLHMEFIAVELAESNIKHCFCQQDTDILETLQCFREMCKAVQRIHRLNIYHRDLKPANFFILANRSICLGDFGSAFNEEEGHLPIQYRVIFWAGDVYYTALEILGQTNDNTEAFRRADVYSLGAILFEMITKVQLFTYVTNEAFKRQLSQIMGNRLFDSSVASRDLSDIVTTLVRRNELPDIWDFCDYLPDIIAIRLNRLYKGLASLDSSERMCKFEKVFYEINRCIEVYTNQAKYARLVETKRLWQERHKQRVKKRQMLA